MTSAKRKMTGIDASWTLEVEPKYMENNSNYFRVTFIIKEENLQAINSYNFEFKIFGEKCFESSI